MKPSLLHHELENAGLPVVGVASTGRIDYSRDLSQDEFTLAAAIIAAHKADGLLPWEQAAADAAAAKNALGELPDYAAWTPQETQEQLTKAVLGGRSLAQIVLEIDNLPNTVAGMKTGLKIIAAAIVDLRGTIATIGKILTLMRIIVGKKI